MTKDNDSSHYFELWGPSQKCSRFFWIVGKIKGKIAYKEYLVTYAYRLSDKVMVTFTSTCINGFPTRKIARGHCHLNVASVIEPTNSGLQRTEMARQIWKLLTQERLFQNICRLNVSHNSTTDYLLWTISKFVFSIRILAKSISSATY